MLVYEFKCHAFSYKICLEKSWNMSFLLLQKGGFLAAPTFLIYIYIYIYIYIKYFLVLGYHGWNQRFQEG